MKKRLFEQLDRDFLNMCTAGKLWYDRLLVTARFLLDSGVISVREWRFLVRAVEVVYVEFFLGDLSFEQMLA